MCDACPDPDPDDLTRAQLAETAPMLFAVAKTLDEWAWAQEYRLPRCRNCDHDASFHSEGGCWYALTRARRRSDTDEAHLGCQCPDEAVVGHNAGHFWTLLHEHGYRVVPNEAASFPLLPPPTE